MFYYFIDARAVAVALTCIHMLRVWSKRRKALSLPPGPKRLPLVGNILEAQEPEPWEAARKWQKEYGPLISLEILGTPVIFVNSYEIAVELFERRGHMYSSRPQHTMFNLENWDWFIGVMPYGDELRRSRQLMHRFLRPGVMKDYAEVQSQAMHKMLDRLLRNPNDYFEVVRQAMGEIIILMSYGFKVQGKNDPYIEIAEKGLAALSQAEEFFLVNFFPSLQYLPSWLPGTGFKKVAEEGYRASMAMYNDAFEFAKEKQIGGDVTPSMMSKLYESFNAGDTVISDESLIKKATAVFYAAGADTLVSSFSTFLLAMLLYPEVQKRAQNELDEVVGRGRDALPSFEDRPNLPYINAVLKETMRWQPVLPLAVAHKADEADECCGYLIPKGVSIWPNIWAMHRDAKEYPEPDLFIPERWLPVDGKAPPRDVNKTFFGFGRRICQGRHFVDNMMFIGAASILAAFNITKALDEDGVPITPAADYEPHFTRHCKPFKYVLTPRSDEIKTVIQNAVAATT